MSENFWTALAQPIIGLSPMDGVTDHPFRHITKKYGQPAVVYTEFTSTEGVCHGASQLLKDFLYDETQRPIVAQIYGTTPDFFRQCAIVLCELGFDGIDVNMGCPAKNVAHAGAGAALIQTPKLAQDIIRATQTGVEEWLNGATSRHCRNISQDVWQEVERRHTALPVEFQTRRRLPISVKTRIGYETPVIDDWISTLLEMKLAAIAIHGRTLKQQYGGQASWEAIGRASQLAFNTSTLILGNGDIASLADAMEKIQTYHPHGVLLGRVAMGNPFVFQKMPGSHNLFTIALEHARLYETTYGHDPKYNFLPMRKHLGWYIHDIPNASQIRQEIYRCNTSNDFLTILKQHSLA